VPGCRSGAILPFIYGLKRFPQASADTVTIVAVIGGIVLGDALYFISRQRRLAYPFRDLSLFRRREFGAALTMNLLVIVAVFGLFFFLSPYLQLVLGL
jgi:DHA2 family multidrug resistance protein-like MFS transporter